MCIRHVLGVRALNIPCQAGVVRACLDIAKNLDC